MSRTQVDTVIDDDDDVCPLCIEEFDLSDKNFKPCPCGYQICQFCYNNIKIHSDEGRCPNCRRVYEERNIEYKVPDADEFKADLALKHRKAAAAKKREVEKREIEASSRKNLAGVRVVQKNLVYVIGLNPTIKDENQLLQTLRGDRYFGQYGDIEKIVVSKAKIGGGSNQGGIGVYVTFTKKQDAATCIAAVDGSSNGDRILRAQYGTTKYCSSFLRNETCNNRNCTFLHETGDDTDTFNRQDLPSMGSSRPHTNGSPYTHPAQLARAAQANAAANSRQTQPHKDDHPPGAGSDGSALPSSASWASKDSQLQRTSRTGIKAAASPRGSNATLAGKGAEKRSGAEDSCQKPAATPAPASVESPPAPSEPADVPQPTHEEVIFQNLVKAVSSPSFRFVFSSEDLPSEEKSLTGNYPSLIDPCGGVKRRAMREKAEQEKIKREAEGGHQSVFGIEEGHLGSGSSQLGGEPDDAQSTAGPIGRTSRPQSTVHPFLHQSSTSPVVGSPASINQQLQTLNLNGRSLTPLQQQQLMLLKNVNPQQLGFIDQMQPTAYDQDSQARLGIPQIGMPNHARQSSRYSFANEAVGKTSQRILSQQLQAAGDNPLNSPIAPQQFTSGIQGPPPGLKTTGTPAISGGGMFAQGHGFAHMANGLGYGTKPDANPDLFRELIRSRNSTNGMGIPGLDTAKLDLADQNILQARMHPGVAGQALYGNQSQDDSEFPPLSALAKLEDERKPSDAPRPYHSRISFDSQESGRRSSTPKVPPGFSLNHVNLTPPKLDSPTLPQPSVAKQEQQPSTPQTPVTFAQMIKESGATGPSTTDVPSPRTVAKPESVEQSASPKSKSRSSRKEASLPAGNTGVQPGEQAKVGPTGPKANQKANAVAPSRPQSPTSIKPTAQAPPIAPTTTSSSRPNTPATAASRVSDSSHTRQARVLRVVDTPKSEHITNTAAPSIADDDTYTSTSASRANSPPSRIGSAPVRTMTKNQMKKERRAKAKHAEDKKTEEVLATVAPEEPVQTPIVGKKRKTKKARPEPTKTEQARSTSPAKAVPPAPHEEPQPEPKQDGESPTQEEPPLPVEQSTDVSWKAHNTLEQLIIDSESSSVRIKELFLERTTPLPEILGQLHKTGALDLNTHPLFNSSNLNQRTDLKYTAADYDLLRSPIKLTKEHKDALCRGKPVRINMNSADLKDRCLITPQGSVLRYLSAADEDRYLELEKSMSADIDLWKDYPSQSVIEPEFTNQFGGLEALFANPEKFNVEWVDESVAKPNDDSSTDGPFGSMFNLFSMAGMPQRFSDLARTSLPNGSGTGSGAAALSKAHRRNAKMLEPPAISELAAVSDEELRRIIVGSRALFEKSKKQVDSEDKNLASQAKKNRKLVQQGLLAAGWVVKDVEV